MRGHTDRMARYRPALIAAAAALLAAACGNAAEPDAAAPTTTVTVSTTQQATTSTAAPSTTTVQPATSAPATTTEPASDCPDIAPLATPDIDGDGNEDGVWLSSVVGGQRLRVCGLGVDYALELEHSAWYVVVTDIEPDGTDELFLGAPDLEDSPGLPASALYWLEPDGERLVPYTSDSGAGLWIGPRSGAECIDIDGDGARELFERVTDQASSTDASIAWRMFISPARPATVTDTLTTGSFDRSDTASLQRLSGFFCGGHVALNRVAPSAAICDTERDLTFEATPTDLDGDGRTDRIIQHEARGDASLRGADFGGLAVAVCLSSGTNDELPVGGQGEVFDVDRGPGGQPVIWTGGTTASAAYMNALVVDSGRLVFVDDPGAEFGFGLWDGFQGWDNSLRIGVSGCEDTDGDGEEEFTQVEAEVVGDVLTWTRQTWTFDGRTATPGPSTSGSLPLPDEFDVETGSYDLVSGLTSDTC